MSTANPKQEPTPFGFRGVFTFLGRTKGRGRLEITDILTYIYLIAGVFVMFGPVLWLVMSSFKDESLLFEPKPSFLPYRQARTHVEGYDEDLLLYDVTFNNVYIEEAQIVIPDLRASNGVVHGIDHVLLTPELKAALAELDTTGPLEGIGLVSMRSTEPETVWDIVETQDDLRFMATLIYLVGLDDLLDGEDRYTLIAPTNAAFEQFMEEYGEATFSALIKPENAELLKALVNTHILADRFLVVNLYRSLEEPVPTLAGTSLTLSMVPGETRRLAQVGSPQGAKYTLIDPADPAAGPFDVFSYITPQGPSTELKAVREVYFNTGNYTGAMEAFDFWTYLRNSVIVTVAATILTLIVNSMAAFGLSKYKFAGREVVFLIIISTLMVPVSVILIPAFLVISKVGWVNNLMGLIVPGAATPTGVFLLRQYMLTIPDELLDAARIDGASEWRIYWQVILPLARPALAVLAIFSIMWRWNDFLWPLIVVSRNELFTLQVGLNAFQGALDVQWHYILAMTVLTLLPITIVFAFLQRFITSGIATTGMKG